MGTLSSRLLMRLAHRDPRRTLRILARMQIAGVFGDEERQRGRALLVIAARSGDRYAGWLGAIYFRDGLLGFPIIPEAAEYWRARTERRLVHDLEYAPEDRYAEMLAAYRQWQSLWPDHSVPSDTPSPQTDTHT